MLQVKRNTASTASSTRPASSPTPTVPSADGSKPPADDDTGTVDDAVGVYVMKRVLASRGQDIRLSGLREGYFGRLLQQSGKAACAAAAALATEQQQGGQAGQETGQQTGQQTGQPGNSVSSSSSKAVLCEGHDHVVRFVDSFEVPTGGDVWLVFKVSTRIVSSVYKFNAYYSRCPKFLLLFNQSSQGN